jgi:hypothetical protein
MMTLSFKHEIYYMRKTGNKIALCIERRFALRHESQKKIRHAIEEAWRI